MPVSKIDPNVIFASDAPSTDKPPVFNDKTKGWDEARTNDGRPTIKQMNKLQQDTDLKILWLNENAVAPYDESIDYPEGAVTLKDGLFKIFEGGAWVEFLDKSSIGLGNVDNTSDLDKPISTATQTALNAKADLDPVKRGIANTYDDLLSYNINDRVLLDDGTEVISTIASNTNDPNVNMTGWLNPSTYPDVITARNVGFKCDGSDETALALQCIENGFHILIPIGSTIGIDVSSGIGTQWAYGLGEIKWLNYVASENMERVVNSNVPVHAVNQHTYQQQQNADVRGALGGKNVGKRFECNPTKPNNYTFDSMQTLIDYGGADIIADMVAITDREVKQYTGVTYTSSTAQHESFKTDDIQAGDYIRAGSNILGVVLSVDKSSGLITLIDGWGNTDSKELNVTPLSGSVCYTPIAYRMWGRNDYVTARANNSEIYNIIGYELDIVAGHDLQDACGFFSVAFGTDTCKAAFRTGRGTRNWWWGLHCPRDTVNAGLYVESGATFAVQHGANYTENSVTVYSSQAYKGMKVTYASESGLDVDNTPTAVVANNVGVGLNVVGGSDIGLQFNGTNSNAKAVATQTNSGYLLHSEIAGLGSYTVSSTGQTNRTRKVVTNVTSDITLNRDNSTNMVIASGAVANISLSAVFQDGEVIEIKSTLSSDVVVKDQRGSTIATLSSTGKSYGRFLLNNGNWIKLFLA